MPATIFTLRTDHVTLNQTDVVASCGPNACGNSLSYNQTGILPQVTVSASHERFVKYRLPATHKLLLIRHYPLHRAHISCFNLFASFGLKVMKSVSRV